MAAGRASDAHHLITHHPLPMNRLLTPSLSRLLAAALALAAAAPLLPAAAGPAQRLAQRRGISIKQARQIINRSMMAGPADPNAGNGGSVFVDPAGPGVGPAPVQP